MKESYRGQCNLHLHFAKKTLQMLGVEADETWGGHYERAMVESVLWQLQLAYQAHLADMLTQQPKFPQTLPSGRVFTARDFKASELPPEILELADREIHSHWLQLITRYSYIKHPADISMSSPNLIAREQPADWPQANELEASLGELTELVARHRATLMEY